MVHMQDENDLQSPRQDGVDLIPLCGQAEHHVQKILCIIQIITRVNYRLPCKPNNSHTLQKQSAKSIKQLSWLSSTWTAGNQL